MPLEIPASEWIRELRSLLLTFQKTEKGNGISRVYFENPLSGNRVSHSVAAAKPVPAAENKVDFWHGRSEPLIVRATKQIHISNAIPCLSEFSPLCDNRGTGNPLMDDDSTTRLLIVRAEEGDASAASELVDRHRDRLKRMVGFRLDPRLSARLDASDVVQDTMAEAVVKLPDYLRRRPLPFYPWLRQMAWERVVHLHAQHLQCEKRSVLRECEMALPTPDFSRIELAQQLFAKSAGPSTVILRKERAAQAQQAIDQLGPNYREVLLLRYVEQLSMSEIAAALGISVAAVKMRHVRALERLRELLEDSSEAS